jgi:hypothetical protein
LGYLLQKRGEIDDEQMAGFAISPPVADGQQPAKSGPFGEFVG